MALMARIASFDPEPGGRFRCESFGEGWSKG